MGRKRTLVSYRQYVLIASKPMAAIDPTATFTMLEWVPKNGRPSIWPLSATSFEAFRSERR